MKEIAGRSIVAGKLCDISESIYKVTNPTTGIEIDQSFYEAPFLSIDKAVFSAASVFTQFRKTRPETRVLLLKSIAFEIQKNKELIIEKCFEETGISMIQLEGEMTRTINQIFMFADLISDEKWKRVSIDQSAPDRKPIPKPDLRLTFIPIGPVAVFGAGNFPLAFSVAGGDTISAFAAGCPVIYKIHPGHPGTSELVAYCIYSAIAKSLLPPEIFSVLHGISNDVGKELVTHPLIKGVGFTGSYKGGKALFDLCVRRKNPIPFFGEMGSINPVYILPEAMKKNWKEIANGLFQSFTLRTGQFCTNPGLFVFIENNDSQKFIDYLSALIHKSEPGVMTSEKIANQYQKKIRDTMGKNVILKRAEGRKGSGKFMSSPILMTVSAKMFINNIDLEEEIFGPATLGVASSSMFDILQVASIIRGQLTTTVHALESDFKKYSELFKIIEEKAGRVILNGFPTGVEVCNSMHHGGPFPASTSQHFTSVGINSVYRWVRPISYQNYNELMLPEELKDK